MTLPVKGSQQLQTEAQNNSAICFSSSLCIGLSAVRQAKVETDSSPCGVQLSVFSQKASIYLCSCFSHGSPCIPLGCIWRTSHGFLSFVLLVVCAACLPVPPSGLVHCLFLASFHFFLIRVHCFLAVVLWSLGSRLLFRSCFPFWLWLCRICL